MLKPAEKFEVLIFWQKSHQLRYYFLLSRDLEYLNASESWDDVDEVARMLGAYTSTLQSPAW